MTHLSVRSSRGRLITDHICDENTSEDEGVFKDGLHLDSQRNLVRIFTSSFSNTSFKSQNAPEDESGYQG